jgi:hypothetical protein
MKGIAEPERQVTFRVPWQDDRGEIPIDRRWPRPWWRTA